MLKTILILMAITSLPAFELRASIPYAILGGTVPLPMGWSVQGMQLPWPTAFAVCTLANILLGILVYPAVHYGFHLMAHIPLLGQTYRWWQGHVQRKLTPAVEKWGTWGLAVFIAVPLPGSGTYSGAVGASLLGISFRPFVIANTLGVTIAGIIVTAMTVSGQNLWDFFTKLN